MNTFPGFFLGSHAAGSPLFQKIVHHVIWVYWQEDIVAGYRAGEISVPFETEGFKRFLEKAEFGSPVVLFRDYKGEVRLAEIPEID